MKNKLIAGLLTALFVLFAGVGYAQQQIRNVSTRAVAGVGSEVLVAGFIIRASPNAPATTKKKVLIRAVGPTLGLAPFNLQGVLAAPKLELFQNQTRLAINEGWDGLASTQQVFNQVGAFPLGIGSKDAVILMDLDPGEYSGVITGTPAGGIALIEVWDVTRDTGVSKFINVSARVKVIGDGAEAAFVGVVLDGNGTKTMLARGVGPELATFGVANSLSNPNLSLYDGSGALRAFNDNWNTSSVSSLITLQAGAFSLTAGGTSSALLFTTTSGQVSYSMKVGQAGANGIALAELYEVP